MTQYLFVKFRPQDERSYTYHHDGDAVHVGDYVQVPLPHGRRMKAEIIGISRARPPFATKPIGKVLKRAKPEPEAMRDEEFRLSEGDAK